MYVSVSGSVRDILNLFALTRVLPVSRVACVLQRAIGKAGIICICVISICISSIRISGEVV